MFYGRRPIVMMGDIASKNVPIAVRLFAESHGLDHHDGYVIQYEGGLYRFQEYDEDFGRVDKFWAMEDQIYREV